MALYGSDRLLELFITKFKPRFKRGFTGIVSWAGRLREWSLELYLLLILWSFCHLFCFLGRKQVSGTWCWEDKCYKVSWKKGWTLACEQALLFGRVAPSLARSREAHFAYPNRRACSQASWTFTNRHIFCSGSLFPPVDKFTRVITFSKTASSLLKVHFGDVHLVSSGWYIWRLSDVFDR